MSTVQSILDNLQFRIDTGADLYHVINLAIRMVAKRLYAIESDIVTAELDVNAWAQVSVSGTDITFVDGGAGSDTITSAALNFATEGFIAGMWLSSSSIANPGPYKLTNVAAHTLTMATGLLTAEGPGTYTLFSEDGYGDLPSDFWGFKDKPTVSGCTYPLEPLPAQAAGLQLTSAGVPAYYRRKGVQIFIYPPTASDIEIIGDYFAKPAAVSAVGDTMPFNELFDDTIGEAVLLYFDKGFQITALEEYISKEVDRVAGKADRKAPKQHSGGINWDSMMR